MQAFVIGNFGSHYFHESQIFDKQLGELPLQYPLSVVLTKVIKCGVFFQQLRDGIQLRSNTFQLIRAAFDDEVSVEEVDNLRKNIHRIR